MEQVVAIVPIESLLYSIAFSEENIAMQCCDNLLSLQIEIPPSFTMLRVSHRALYRLLIQYNDPLGLGSLQRSDDKEMHAIEIAVQTGNLKSATKEAQKHLDHLPQMKKCRP